MSRIGQKQLEIFENSFLEVTRTSGLITNVTVYTDGTKTIKKRDVDVGRTAGLVTTITNNDYDSGGTLKETETQTVARVSGLVDNITKVIS